MQPWHQSARTAIRKALSVIKTIPPMRLSVWMDEHFYLSAESSYTEQSWRCHPHQIGIIDAFGNDDIKVVAVRKSARMGYSKMMQGAMCYFSAIRRRNQALFRPTDSDAQEFVETELNNALRDVKAMRNVFPALGKKHQHNTNSYKRFLGCVTYIRGGSSARAYRAITVHVVILDEIDGFDRDIDQEGGPRKLAHKRTEGAPFPKMIVGSTPKLKYLSEITDAISESDAIYRYHIPCPHCEALQPLEFGDKTSAHGLKWRDNDPSTTRYLCVACACLFSQAEYLAIHHMGRWQDKDGNYYDHQTGKFCDYHGNAIRPPEKIAFDQYWTIYAPYTDQSSWVNIVKEYLAAVTKARHGDKSILKTFVNQTLGLDYEDDVEKTDAKELKSRAEDYPLQIVQMGGLVIKAFVDVQKDRFELLAAAIGRGEEMWVIDHQVIAADPSVQADWDKLDPFLLHKYPHVAGGVLAIDSVGIDTGGHWTHQCYNYVRLRKWGQGWTQQPAISPPKVYATKGDSASGKPISGRASLQDVNVFDKVIKSGIKLHFVGTDTAKDLLHGRLNVRQTGPGFIHFSRHLPDVFFEQLTNEVRVHKQTTKGMVSAWVLKRPGLRNEILDCMVGILFCAHKSALHRKSNAEWTVLENIVQPNQHDIFSIIDTVPIAVAKPTPTITTPMPPPQKVAATCAKRNVFIPDHQG